MADGFSRVGRGVVLASALLGGCQNLTKVKVDPGSAKLDSAGKTVQFHAEQIDAEGKAMQNRGPVEWASDNGAVATIEKDGTATATKSGKATIIATVGSVKGQASLEVHIPSRIAGEDLTIEGSGKSQVLSVKVFDDADELLPQPPGSLSFDSGDLKVAIVALQGSKWIATGVSAGSTTITAKFGTLKQAFGCKVLPN